MLRIRFILAFATFLIFAACAAPGASRAQVPPKLTEYKDADWQVSGEVYEVLSSEGDTVRVIRGGTFMFGKVDEEDVAYCEGIVADFFPLSTLAPLAKDVMETASGYGDNAPLGLQVSCVQLIGAVQDSISTR